MAQYTFPNITPSRNVLTRVTNSKKFVSPLTGATQTTTRGGGRWMLEQEFDNLITANRADLFGFVALLDGQVHRANITDHSYTGARGALGATIVIDGASQTGKTLSVKETASGTSSISNFLRRGDFLSFQNSAGIYELKIVTEDFDLSSGTGDVSIWPEIHNSPADAAAINTSSPQGTFILMDDETARPSEPGNSDGEAFSTIRLRWVEDISG